MRFEGRVWKEGKFWLIEVPMLDVATQGTSKADAFEMLLDVLRGYTNFPDLEIRFFQKPNSTFELGSKDVKQLIALCLKRKRMASGLSLKQVSKRLNRASRNAYARYESGQATPTVHKFLELLAAVDPEHDVLLTESRID